MTCRRLAVTAAAAVAAAILLLLGVPPLTAAQQGGAAADSDARVAALRRTLDSHPANFNAALELATTLHQLDHAAPNGGKRVPEAAAAYRRAAQLAASPAARAYVNSNLGALLLAGGRVGEAADAMHETLALARQLDMQRSDLYVGTLFNLAKAEQQLGRQEASQALMGQVLELADGVAGGTYLKAWAALKAPSPAQLKEMAACARYLRRKRTGVDEAGLSGRQRTAWHELQARWSWLDGLSEADQSWIGFGLFHAYQQAGRFEDAWRALHEANQLQDRAAPYDPAQDDANTAAILAMFQPPKPASADPAEATYAALMRGAAGFSGGPTRPIFVVGMPRSGSTLVEQILASHSQVWGAGEDTALAPLLPDLLAVLRGGGEVRAAEIQEVGLRYQAEMRGRVPPERAESVVWIVDKMLRNMWNVGFIAMMLPDACILHAARHPADAALSCYAQPFEGRGTPWASNLTAIAHQVELVQRLADHWDVVLPGRVLHVRYEDLIRDQQRTTRRMLQHCGIPWEPGVLDFYTTQRTVATASLAQVRQRLYADSVLQYRRYAAHLAPLLSPMRHWILRYEREAGLESSAALLAEVLGGGEAQQQQQQQQQAAGGPGSSSGSSSGSSRGGSRGGGTSGGPVSRGDKEKARDEL
ncbi:hypothetical protein D9Q98_010530 [Chlorella vulgaris]|uniref:protein-tyrosine sulfotransferase n=1 Tax=Chlorella vulgaris TaxID=3077 RepID=A0A9D4TQK8_CHLVU|nr:hypothetical protein D9Q98_010530 [Chlorella vulgaris]